MVPRDGERPFLSPGDGDKGTFFYRYVERGVLYGRTDYAHGNSVQADRQIGD